MEETTKSLLGLKAGQTITCDHADYKRLSIRCHYYSLRYHQQYKMRTLKFEDGTKVLRLTRLEDKRRIIWHEGERLIEVGHLTLPYKLRDE